MLDVAKLQFVGRSISVFLTFNILCCTVYLHWRIQERDTGTPPPPPLIFRPNWGPKSQKYFFGRLPPPPHPPPSLPQSLDPALICVERGCIAVVSRSIQVLFLTINYQPFLFFLCLQHSHLNTEVARGRHPYQVCWWLRWLICWFLIVCWFPCRTKS